MSEQRVEIEGVTGDSVRLFQRDRTAALISVPNETLDRYVREVAYATRRTRAILAKEIGEAALAGLLEHRSKVLWGGFENDSTGGEADGH